MTGKALTLDEVRNGTWPAYARFILAPGGLPPAVIVGGVPDADGEEIPEQLACPACGKTRLTRYYEDIANRRDVVGLVQVEGKHVLEIQSFYETDGCDDGENPRLVCDECFCECLVPEGIELEFT
jgi:hypothetical protein